VTEGSSIDVERAAAHPSHPWCAAALDVMMRPLRPLREKLVPLATGRVVEIGVGTGMNFDYYAGVDSVHGVEPDPHMLARARSRAATVSVPIELTQAGAEALPYDDASFDTALVTWVLCTIPDPLAAVREVVRVLKPGGRMLFVEHVRSRFRLASALQAKATPLWMKIGGGCRLDRDSLGLIRQSGLQVAEVKPCGREGWTLIPMYRGVALKL
jgi:ubiquinone/menaquinone biosynthesis C-methylase UbiE